MRQHSRFDLLQEVTQVLEALTPEHAVMIHPGHQRLQSLRRGAVVDVAALRALGDEAGLLEGLQMLRDRALGDATAARQLRDADFLALEHPLEHGAAGRIGEGAHHGGDGVWGGFDHVDKLASANSLVNTNYSTSPGLVCRLTMTD